MMWLGAFLALSTAWAEVPPPSYRDHLALGAWHEVNERLETGDRRIIQDRPEQAGEQWRAAIQHAEQFESQVMQTAGLAYLKGLSYRRLKDDKQAEKEYRRSLKLDPRGADAWHDLGEILLVQGRFVEAEECFRHVTELVVVGPEAWLGPFRMAETAAHRGRPKEFEEDLREAIARGFRFEHVRNLPNWRRFYADPVMHDSIEKLVMVYGDQEILQDLAP